MDNKLEFNWDTIGGMHMHALDPQMGDPETEPSNIEVWIASSAPTSTTTNTDFGADPIASDYKYIETISKDDSPIYFNWKCCRRYSINRI